MTVGITIDWDYFVPYDRDWDIQHQESLLYLEFIWKTRGYLLSEIKTAGEEKTFWPWLHKHFGTSEELLTVSDSHACVVKDPSLWTGCDTIISFDQHHDCWPTEDDNRDENYRIIHVACHTWARAWLEDDPDRTLVWVYPDHMDLVGDYGDLTSDESRIYDLIDRIDILPRKDFDPRDYADDVSGVHLCRSGCWVPPWLDAAFIQFVKDSGLLFDVVQDGDWDPLRERWQQCDMDEMMRLHEESRRAFEEIHAMEAKLAHQRQG
jgi:hypothetical protein